MPVNREWFPTYLQITLNIDQKERLLETKQIPGDALIDGDWRAFSIFGLNPRQWRWREVAEKLEREGRGAWARTLELGIFAAIFGEQFHDTLPLLRPVGPLSELSYRAIIYRLDTLADGARRLKLIFSEVKPEEDPGPPGDLGDLIALLVVSRRIRWGVLEQYRSKILHLKFTNADAGKTKECMEKLYGELIRLGEVSLRSIRVPEDVTRLFDDDKDTVKGAMDEWGKLWPGLIAALRQGEPDVDSVLHFLEEVRRVNGVFLAAASKRYAELMQNIG